MKHLQFFHLKLWWNLPTQVLKLIKSQAKLHIEIDDWVLNIKFGLIYQLCRIFLQIKESFLTLEDNDLFFIFRVILLTYQNIVKYGLLLGQFNLFQEIKRPFLNFKFSPCFLFWIFLLLKFLTEYYFYFLITLWRRSFWHLLKDGLQ